MANINKAALKVESNNTYVNNNSGLITPDNIRALNTDLIDSLAAQDQVTDLSSSFLNVSSSFAGISSSVATLDTSEFIIAAQTASMVVDSSSYAVYAVTASYALNGGGGGQVDTASLVDTSSFNTYTASQAAKGFATTGSNTYNDDQIFGRNIEVNGTASIAYLNAGTINSKFVSSGSNKLGDDATDVQQLVGIVQVTGSLTATGKATLSGSFIGEFNGTASMAVSSSYALSASFTDTASYINLENDTLSFGNKTGILQGGVMTKGTGNTINVSAGKAQIVSQSYEGPNYIKTAKSVVQWNAITNIALDFLNTHPVTFFYVDRLGDVYQQTASFQPSDLRDKIILGSVTHGDNDYISHIENDQITGYNSYKDSEIANIYGVSKIRGLQLDAISSSLSLRVNSGSIYHNGAGYSNDPWNANSKEIPLVPSASFIRIHQSGSKYIYDVSASLFGPQYHPALDPNQYVNLNTGLLVTASDSFFTTQRIYQAPDNPSVLYAYYGPQEYQFVDEAVNAIAFEKFEEDEGTKNNTTFLGYVVLQKGAPSLVNPTFGVIIYSGINRSIFLSTGTNIGALQSPVTSLTYTYNTPAMTWSLAHNLQVDFPSITTYRSESKEVVIPEKIKSIDSNNVDVYFSYPFAGVITVLGAGAQIVQGDTVTSVGALSTASFNAWTGSSTSKMEGSSSYALTASYVQGFNSITSSYSLFALTASYISGAIDLPATYSNAISSSLAEEAETSSFSFTASYINLARTASQAFTASFLLGSVETASYVRLAQTASRAFTASWAVEAIDARDAIQARSASLAETASYALRTGIADGLAQTQSLAWTASWVGVAQTASRVVGVNVIGTVSSSITSSHTVGTASYAVSALTSSFAITSSFIFVTQSNVTSASWASQSLSSISASFATTALTASFFSGSISNAVLAQTASFVQNAQFATSSLTASHALTASFVSTALTASFIAGRDVVGFVSNSFSASYVQTAQTASFVTGSNVIGIVNSSFSSSLSETASFVSGAIRNFPDTDGTIAVVNTISTISSASYAALATKDVNTLYVVI